MRTRIAIVLICLVSWSVLGQAQTDPLNTSPRGMSDLPSMRLSAAQATLIVPGANPANTVAVAAPLIPQMPPDPTTAITPIVFGSQMFVGRFSSQTFSGFNPDYHVGLGDRVSIRIWGAYSFEATQLVDSQGNVFVPNVGPIRVAGIRNGDLNREVESQTRGVFKANVGVYATLEGSQPVKVYVTGFVKAPGLYAGLSSDSLLYYLDKAGGIDPDRGSFLDVDVIRGGKPRARFNLYRFLLEGDIATVQLQDGDTIVAHSRKQTVTVMGEVVNPYMFEFLTPQISATQLLYMARAKPGATHLKIVRKLGKERRTEYHPLSSADTVMIDDGDEVTLTSDRSPGTILVQVQGAHLGERSLVLPYGSRIHDALQRLRPAPQSRVEALQLYRKSISVRQKELLDASLQNMETYALTARSATSEEAALRSKEAEMLLNFIDRARKVVPKGQVILANKTETPNTLLEDGDILIVPEVSNLIIVSGEVLFPNALVYEPNAKAADYIAQAGGYTQNSDDSKVIVLRQDGSVAKSSEPMRAGDQVMVLPRVDSKRIEVTRGITQILYQIAIAAKVIFSL